MAVSHCNSQGPTTAFKVKISERGFFPAIDDSDLSLVYSEARRSGARLWQIMGSYQTMLTAVWLPPRHQQALKPASVTGGL